MDMEGKVALVTGAAGVIGTATSRLLASRGAQIVAVDLPGTDWSAFADALPDAVLIEADVTQEGDWRRIVSECVAKAGGPHMFFNNAGIEGKVIPFEQMPLEEFERVMDVNVKGVFLGLKHVGPAIAAAGGGAIVNTSSVAGLQGGASTVGYSTSKHAVIGLSRSAALAFGPRGVRVNSVHPGAIESRMMKSLEDASGRGNAMRDGMISAISAGRYGEAEEVAELVAFLLSDNASYCHASSYLVDGGLTQD